MDGWMDGWISLYEKYDKECEEEKKGRETLSYEGRR